jgi:hypothetical protein
MLKMFLTLAVTCVVASGCASTASAPKSPTATAADTPANADCKYMITGSRIPQNGCAPGQTYTQEDLQRTGQQQTSKALDSADPTVQIHH